MDGSRVLKMKNNLAQKLLKKVLERQETPDFLTVREAAKSFRAKHQEIIDLADDLGLNVNVGIRSGAGMYIYEQIGDCSIECLNLKDAQERVDFWSK
jgi:hypothetical protein